MTRSVRLPCRLVLQASACLLAGIIPSFAEQPQPFGEIGGQWTLVETLSDEFNAATIDTAKWENDPGDWGVWSWEPENARTQDGSLRLRMVQDTHRRGKQEFFYKSGIVRSREKATYGYFEARVKGCSRFPGASPAFWLYSHGEKFPGRVKYCEIDIIELQQANWTKELRGPTSVSHIDMNLHYTILNDKGVAEFRRPHQYPDLLKHWWVAPWDPRDDFHVYAAHVTKEQIVWYIDGVERARADNLYWHLPMSVTLSLGLRWPFVAYRDGERLPVPEKTTGEGFPTEMLVDYVRMWRSGD